jgi:hypothetical protein
MTRIARRLQRLESACALADLHSSLLRLGQKAGQEVELAPSMLDHLCMAVGARLQVLRAAMPAWLTEESQVDTHVIELTQLLRAIIDGHVIDGAQRYQFSAALSAGCQREAQARWRGIRP